MALIRARDKRWQAESDARTLAEAGVITGDRSRLKSAALAAQRLQKKAQDDAVAMRSVARKKRVLKKKKATKKSGK